MEGLEHEADMRVAQARQPGHDPGDGVPDRAGLSHEQGSGLLSGEAQAVPEVRPHGEPSRDAHRRPRQVPSRPAGGVRSAPVGDAAPWCPAQDGLAEGRVRETVILPREAQGLPRPLRPAGGGRASALRWSGSGPGAGQCVTARLQSHSVKRVADGARKRFRPLPGREPRRNPAAHAAGPRRDHRCPEPAASRRRRKAAGIRPEHGLPAASGDRNGPKKKRGKVLLERVHYLHLPGSGFRPRIARMAKGIGWTEPHETCPKHSRRVERTRYAWRANVAAVAGGRDS